MVGAPFTEATTGYWQALLPPDSLTAEALAPPWRLAYPARLPDGRTLMLPIRALPALPLARPGSSPGVAADEDPDGATDARSGPVAGVASLLVNQASLQVTQSLAEALAAALQPLRPEVVVGLPTLGLALAPAVAQALGHSRYVPMGTSRKFWYDEALSAAVRSITSPGVAKRVYLDPHLLPLLHRRRVALVDDVLSTGSTAGPVWQLLQDLGLDVVAYGVAMTQGERWRQVLADTQAARVVSVFSSPLLMASAQGWVVRE